MKLVFDGLAYENEAVELLKESPNIAPYGLHSGGIAWREGLEKCAIVDCMDTAAAWYRSTVIDMKVDEAASSKKVIMVQVGYRRYEEGGTKKDADGRAYNGWSNTYDEWLNVFSIRIQRPDTIAKIGRIACKKSIDDEDKEKPNVEDLTDILLNNIEGEDIYTILRPDKVKSKAVIGIINAFGKEGGFEKMIQRIQDKAKPVAYGTFCVAC